MYGVFLWVNLGTAVVSKLKYLCSKLKQSQQLFQSKKNHVPLRMTQCGNPLSFI